MPYLYRRSNSPAPSFSSLSDPSHPQLSATPGMPRVQPRAWIATTLPSARRPIRPCPSISSHSARLFPLVRSDLMSIRSSIRPSSHLFMHSRSPYLRYIPFILVPLLPSFGFSLFSSLNRVQLNRCQAIRQTIK